MNDPSELRHGLSRAQTILSQKAAAGPPESKIFAKDFAGLGKGLERAAHTFTCSVSETGDGPGGILLRSSDGIYKVRET